MTWGGVVKWLINLLTWGSHLSVTQAARRRLAGDWTPARSTVPSTQATGGAGNRRVRQRGERRVDLWVWVGRGIAGASPASRVAAAVLWDSTETSITGESIGIRYMVGVLGT